MKTQMLIYLEGISKKSQFVHQHQAKAETNTSEFRVQNASKQTLQNVFRTRMQACTTIHRSIAATEKKKELFLGVAAAAAFTAAARGTP
jgi:hypothetical protein